MFKRKGDIEEHNYLYILPAAIFCGTFLASHYSGYAGIYQMGYLASSLCCIGGIAGLASQKTARVGNALGIIGITGGMITTLSVMGFT